MALLSLIKEERIKIFKRRKGFHLSCQNQNELTGIVGVTVLKQV